MKINSLSKLSINIQINSFLKLALQNNFKTWIVGGAVRDSLINAVVKDIDVVIDGEPEEILRFLKKNNVVIKNKFLNYGSFVLKFNGINFNLTCLRDDYNYDGRHSKVFFTKSLSVDSKRRDLTFNALYININRKIIDFYNGLDDLKNSRLIFIGKFREKCLEDHLRILRYIRFCSIFKNPYIPENYLKHFIEHSYLLKKIPKKKIIEELKKIFANNYFYNSIKLIKYLNLNDFLLNEVLIQEQSLRKKLKKHL